MPLLPPLRSALAAAALAGALAACRGDAPDAPPVPVAPPPDPVATAPPPAADTLAGTGRAASTDTLTVVFFGDSLTEGYGLAGGKAEAYPALIEARVREEGLPVRVVNAGVSGNTSADGRARIGWTLGQATPDVFVLALGANDGLRGLPPEATRENLAAILTEVRRANPRARVVVAGMEAPPNYGADYTTRYRAVYPALAEAFDGALVPFLLDRVAGVAALNQRDRVHPTAEGQRILAETVWETLGPILRQGVRV